MTEHSTILVADDDNDDVALLKYAFNEAGIKNSVRFVDDGEELLTFLKAADAGEHALPSLIFLDLNMPKIGGHEALKLMKENPRWKIIPVLVFSTSDFKDDIAQVYSMGASGYIIKPPRYANLLMLVKAIKDFWIDAVTLAE
jgi:two-component system response regulator